MKKTRMIFILLCYMVFSTGCTINSGGNASFGRSTVQNISGTNTIQKVKKNSNTMNYMIDDKGNLQVMYEDGYKPYTYDKFPEIPRSLARIIQMLHEGDNIVNFYYSDKLYLSYVLEESKSRIVGGNNVDIFNFSIDREQDNITFSVENLTFYDVIDDDYRPQLLETFNLLFSESGEAIYHFLMEFYDQAVDGIEDETLIDGMLVTYRCTPKHKLGVFLVHDN